MLTELHPPSQRFFFVNLPNALKHFGEDYRMVHSVRDPFTTFASTFIYDQKGLDRIGLTKEDFAGLSLKDALRLKAQEVEGLNTRQLRVYGLGKAHPQVLVVRLEDFDRGFDATTLRIFSFMKGTGRHQQEAGAAFVRLARGADKKRWISQENQIAHRVRHFSDREQTMKVLAALHELCAEGDRGIVKAMVGRQALGYGEACPGPEGG